VNTREPVCRFGVGRTTNERAYEEHIRTVKHRLCNLYHTHTQYALPLYRQLKEPVEHTHAAPHTDTSRY
jgi:hypothetical protein